MSTSPDFGESSRPTALRHFLDAMGRQGRSSRLTSLILLGAMMVVLLLGAQIVYVHDDPRRFALFLALNFTFFLFVILRAALECLSIVRDHVRNREQLFRAEFWDNDFALELGKRVRERS